MTDSELTKACAIEIMGWIKGTDFTEEIFGPEGQFKGIWMLCPDPPLAKELWQPLANYNHAFMVVEKMRKLGFNFCLICRQDGVDAACFTKSRNFSGETKTETFRNRIILEAALKAVREKK